MVPVTPIQGSFWVAPGRLLAGEYPGARDAPTAAKRLRRFADCGVTLYVDLTEPDELEPYAQLLGGGARHVRRPIPDLGTVSPDSYRGILDLIDGALTAGDRVYLHCFGGVGRTGTVVALWLVRHGLDGGDAIARLAELRRWVTDARTPSPETEAQRAVVRNWQSGA